MKCTKESEVKLEELTFKWKSNYCYKPSPKMCNVNNNFCRFFVEKGLVRVMI